MNEKRAKNTLEYFRERKLKFMKRKKEISRVRLEGVKQVVDEEEKWK